MIELVLDVPDLARTSFSISPLEQLLIGSLAVSAHRRTGPRGRWWRRIRTRVPQRAAPLLDLLAASPRGVPDFLLADGTAYLRGFADELDSVLTADDDRIRTELDHCYDRTAPPVVQRLREDGARALRPVVNAAAALYRECLAPDWRDLHRTLDAEVRWRARTVATDGPAAMLDRLHPRLGWHDTGTLTVDRPGPTVRHRLGGRGLQLHPNLFLDKCAVLHPPGRTAALLHPVTRPARPADTPDGLLALLGPARTRALRVIAQGPCTTTELAATLGIAPPSASPHTNALRAAALITTTRQGRRVQHTLTPLGHALLAANPGVEGSPYPPAR
ncbi:ArsR/SmtB family transcription factor [Kitasatospora griseola]|uniref:ArsR/SmtB family transcription factor n=1 Tax=Kitasatospora griseola TaxID=2064 RepID=UPI00382A808F